MAKAHKFVSTFAGIALMCASASYARAEHQTQSSTEVRTYVWLKANADAVQNSLPKGWTVNPPSGLLKDANVAVVLIDGIAASDAEGKPVPFHDKYAVVALPAKNE